MVSKNFKGRILVVDDEVDLAETLRDLIMLYGYEVEIAANGLEAQSCLNLQRYDLVISDIRMPVMDGIQLLSLIHQQHHGTPVILISGFSDYDEKAAAENGSCGLLSKPIEMADLIELIKKNLKSES
jgi:DNA-binding NtrC family response regulator